MITLELGTHLYHLLLWALGVGTLAWLLREFWVVSAMRGSKR